MCEGETFVHGHLYVYVFCLCAVCVYSFSQFINYVIYNHHVCIQVVVSYDIEKRKDETSVCISYCASIVSSMNR